jgi:hypothetical protein
MRTFWVPKRQLRESKPLIHYASDWEQVSPAADVQALLLKIAGETTDERVVYLVKQAIGQEGGRDE